MVTKQGKPAAGTFMNKYITLLFLNEATFGMVMLSYLLRKQAILMKHTQYQYTHTSGYMEKQAHWKSVVWNT
jgi:hypothetical protein